MFRYKFLRTNAGHPHFKQLIVFLDQYLKGIDGEDHSFFSMHNTTDNIQHAIICYADSAPVGCGAFRTLPGNKVEIKRMFVLTEHRKKGIANSILKELEQWAKETGHTAAILETGMEMKPAIALYQKEGYQITENYGPYIGITKSVCMQKDLS